MLCLTQYRGRQIECGEARSWFDDTRVSYEQGRLVLYDASGQPVHRLVRP